GLGDPAARAASDRKTREEQEQLRQLHKGKQQKPLLPYIVANEKRARLTFDDLPVPTFLGRRELVDYPLAEIARYIDWTFFFTAWELRGKFPGILDHPEYGAAARDLYEHAQKILDEIIRGRKLHANAVYGFWPAASDGNDVCGSGPGQREGKTIVVYWDAWRKRELLRLNTLRQQQMKTNEGPQLALADFVAPIGHGDYLGGFAVTAGLGADELAGAYQ